MKNIISLTDEELRDAIRTYIHTHVMPLRCGMKLEYPELPKEYKITITK